MVRLLVRKSLLPAWTSAHPYGRRRAPAYGGGGRCGHRRTVAAVVAAGRVDDDARDIRLDALVCSCCWSSDDTCCCCCYCCCVTDEECQGSMSSLFAVLFSSPSMRCNVLLASAGVSSHFNSRPRSVLIN